MTESVQVGPKTKDVAMGLLDAAKSLGLDVRVVKTDSNGFLVPREVADVFNNAEDSTPEPDAETSKTSKTKAKVTAAAKTEKEGTGNDH